MKAKFTILAVLIAAFFTGFGQVGQPSNGSFETWTSGINPDGWADVETLLQAPFSVLTFKDTSHTVGSFSVKMLADSIQGVTGGHVVGGLISYGTAALAGNSPSFTGVPFTYRPDTLVFDFKYSSPGLDTGAVFLSLSKNFTDQILGVGFALTPVAGWTHVAIPLGQFYADANTPDTIQIQFTASNAMVAIPGSALNVDGLRFGYVNQPAPPITAAITAMSATTFCNGDSVMLMANTGTNYAYQWNLGGNAINGATASSYWAKASGSYTVTIDSATSTATSNAIVLTDSTCHGVGISNISAASLSVYPNPATSLLNINSNENLAGFNLQMFDVVGRLVVNQTLEGTNNTIKVATLSNGTYIYRITDKENGVIAQSKFNVIK